MPAAGRAPWLGEAIDSILLQTFSEWELVIADDGVELPARRLAQRYGKRDPRIHIVDVPRSDRGIVGAQNAALAHARGEFVARMDSDDVAAAGRLGCQLALLESNSDLAAVAGRVRPFPRRAVGLGMQRYLDWQHSLGTPERKWLDRFVESPVVSPSMMYRRSLLVDELGGWHDLGWPEDFDLHLRMFEQGAGIGRVAETVLYWRQHSDQTSRRNGRYSKRNFMKARVHFLSRWLDRFVAKERPLWVLGAGPIGKDLARGLRGEGVDVVGFSDVDPNKVGNSVGRGSSARPVCSMDRLYALEPRPFAISAVGRPGVRERIRQDLRFHGWSESEDYVVAA